MMIPDIQKSNYKFDYNIHLTSRTFIIGGNLNIMGDTTCALLTRLYRCIIGLKLTNQVGEWVDFSFRWGERETYSKWLLTLV